MHRWEPSDILPVGFVLAVAALLVGAAACFGLGALVMVRGGLPFVVARQVTQTSAVAASTQTTGSPMPTAPLEGGQSRTPDVTASQATPGPSPSAAPTAGVTPSRDDRITSVPEATPVPPPSASTVPSPTPPVGATALPTDPPTALPTATDSPAPTATGEVPTEPPTATDVVASPVPTSTDDGDLGDVLIMEIEAVEEWLMLYNFTSAAIDLSGWRIVAETGGTTCALSGLTIEADQILIIWTMPDNVQPGDGTCNLSSGMWNDDYSDHGLLYDAQGQLVDRFPPD